MQQYGNDQILYSPSDLVTFLGCHHASFLDVKALSEDMDKAEASTTGQLLQQKGLEHEAAYLQQLKDEGKSVVEIPKDPTRWRLNITARRLNTCPGLCARRNCVWRRFDAPTGKGKLSNTCLNPCVQRKYARWRLRSKVKRWNLCLNPCARRNCAERRSSRIKTRWNSCPNLCARLILLRGDWSLSQPVRFDVRIPKTPSIALMIPALWRQGLPFDHQRHQWIMQCGAFASC